MGPASPELRAKWDSGEADRAATDDAIMAEHMGTSTVEETPRFQDAVTAAVTQVLEKLGVEIPRERQEGQKAQEEETKIEYDVQLPMLVPAGAPSESDNKHEVSQAPRPELHLVG